MEAKPTANPAGLIYSAIPAIMAEIPSIYKDRKNDAQHYNFRGIDDVYNAVNPILAKHRVFMRADVLEVKREERPPKDNTKSILTFVQVRVRYSFVTSDSSFISTDSLGEGMDSGDKATAKAMSIAQKYAILQMFCIPTADPKDPENDNPDPIKAELEADGAVVNERQPQSPGNFAHLAAFTQAKKKLGNDAYYECLGEMGYEHANQIPVEVRPNVLNEMRLKYKDLHVVQGASK